MRNGRLIGVMALAMLSLALGGCEILYMLGGKGKQESQYKLSAKSRVLVWVDPRVTSGAPVDVPAALGEKVNGHLYQWKVSDHLVSQARLAALRKDPRFTEMGVADAARKLDADVVVFIDLLQFRVETVSAGQLTQGHAQALVKVVDRDGNRLWPADTEVLGVPVEADAKLSFADQATPAVVKDKMMADLTIRIGRLFHEYDLGDKEMIR